MGNVPAVRSASGVVYGCFQSGHHAVATILDGFSGE
jgi:hypothetical protein